MRLANKINSHMFNFIYITLCSEQCAMCIMCVRVYVYIQYYMIVKWWDHGHDQQFGETDRALALSGLGYSSLRQSLST